MKSSTTILCIISLMPILLSAHDMSLHMYIGSQTFDVWRNYDPEFYDSLVSAQTWWEQSRSLHRLSTLKFYYIGLTLPDLLRPAAQDTVRNILNKLYEESSNLCDPLKITETTHNLVQADMIFPTGTNSHNLEKLSAMVHYAKDQHWLPAEKALIYGAYMHALHDMYATFMQASRFGYGKCYDSDSALKYDILRYGELYHELFSQTYIGNWEVFVRPLYASPLLNSANQVDTFYADACNFLRIISVSGQIYTVWQDTNFVAVQRFVEAANSSSVGWSIQNLTQERLESYLHGWAILTFLLYGYSVDDYAGTVGGIYAHPDWGFTYIREVFWWNIGSAYTQWRIINDLPDELE